MGCLKRPFLQINFFYDKKTKFACFFKGFLSSKYFFISYYPYETMKIEHQINSLISSYFLFHFDYEGCLA